MGDASGGKKCAEFIRAARCNYISPCNKKRKEKNYNGSADETKFFADNRENKVVLRFGNIKIFLAGISLPFFSYGGTALMMTLGEMGIVLAVSKKSSIQKS